MKYSSHFIQLHVFLVMVFVNLLHSFSGLVGLVGVVGVAFGCSPNGNLDMMLS